MCFTQDMGQDVESYFQDVSAILEQSSEEGCRGERGALRCRLQQLYSEIVADTDSGRSSVEEMQQNPFKCLLGAAAPSHT